MSWVHEVSSQGTDHQISEPANLRALLSVHQGKCQTGRLFGKQPASLPMGHPNYMASLHFQAPTELPGSYVWILPCPLVIFLHLELFIPQQVIRAVGFLFSFVFFGQVWMKESGHNFWFTLSFISYESRKHFMPDTQILRPRVLIATHLPLNYWESSLSLSEPGNK